MAVIRRPAVAGYYYPAGAEALREATDALIRRGEASSRAVAVIVPHDSFRRSGAIAGQTLSRTLIPRRCLLLGPSHTGSWMRWSLLADGAYRTPLGDVPIDAAFAEALRRRASFLEVDAWTQRGEHAIEVLLPFLQRLGPPDLAIIPIVMGATDEAEWSRLAEAVTQVTRMSEEPCLLIASTDCSHYEPEERAAALDASLIETICSLDRAGLARMAGEGPVRLCGAGAVVCLLEAAAALGATHGTLVRYGTSAEAGGDPRAVVGYAGIVIR